MGWTGGYVLLAMLLAPYLRKFGRFTVPEFIGGRYYSRTARLVAVASLLMISITYVIGQMTGAGVAFSRFRSEEHTSELQSLMRSSYPVFCLKQKTKYAARAGPEGIWRTSRSSPPLTS